MARLRSHIEIFLQPGELFVAGHEYQLRTILGSCVSITLWHPATCTGAMSHFMLPSRGAAKTAAAAELDGRYGDEAMHLMASQLAAQGVAVAQCQGKVFGGGNMFPRHLHGKAINVGQSNGEAARALLRAHGVELVSEHLFGLGHRQVIFDVGNGDVWVHQVRPSHPTLA